MHAVRGFFVWAGWVETVRSVGVMEPFRAATMKLVGFAGCGLERRFGYDRRVFFPQRELSFLKRTKGRTCRNY
jgi:hypothetical protein